MCDDLKKDYFSIEIGKEIHPMRQLTLTLFALLVLLQYYLFLGKNGIFDYFDALRAVETTEMANENLRIRNQEMYADIADLKEGLESIEERARNELGMIKPDETFFRLVKE